MIPWLAGDYLNQEIYKEQVPVARSLPHSLLVEFSPDNLVYRLCVPAFSGLRKKAKDLARNG